MSLTKLAERLKRLARAHGSATEDFEHGAHGLLKFANGKFQLELTRPVKSTRADRFKRWETEVGTFMRDFGVTDKNLISVEYPNTAQTYRAIILWHDGETAPREEINPLPKDEKEMREWAQTLGQGVRVRNVDVFTGEM